MPPAREAPTTDRVVLARHGRTTHPRGGWHDAPRVRDWLAGYEAVGLAAGERPPPSLLELARGADVIASSDIPRALASASLLAPPERVVVTPLLREVDMPVPELLPRLRLPLALWAVAIFARWAYADRRGDHLTRSARAQAGEAASWLAERAAGGRTVLAVTHGSARGLIADAMVRGGWSRAPGRRGYAHWSAWAMTRAG